MREAKVWQRRVYSGIVRSPRSDASFVPLIPTFFSTSRSTWRKFYLRTLAQQPRTKRIACGSTTEDSCLIHLAERANENAKP